MYIRLIDVKTKLFLDVAFVVVNHVQVYSTLAICLCFVYNLIKQMIEHSDHIRVNMHNEYSFIFFFLHKMQII